MSDEKQKALATLVEIAEDINEDADTRIRAACSILDLVKFTEGQKTLLAVSSDVGKDD